MKCVHSLKEGDTKLCMCAFAMCTFVFYTFIWLINLIVCAFLQVGHDAYEQQDNGFPPGGQGFENPFGDFFRMNDVMTFSSVFLCVKVAVAFQSSISCSFKYLVSEAYNWMRIWQTANSWCICTFFTS